MKKIALIFALGVVAAAANAQVITQWNFNASNTTPSTGAGTALLVGGTTATFASGTGSTDTAATNQAWNVSTYPAQGTGDKTAGPQFNVSTVGQSNIVVSLDTRASNTASRFQQFQYTTNGTTFIDFGPAINVNLGSTWFNNNSFDLSSISAVNNNPNFGFRLVTTFGPTSANYEAAQTGSSYGVTGTLRYDMVTVSAVPEPGTMLALGAGLAALAARRRRKSA